MKIVKDNAIYVQKNDIMFLFQNDLSIPASIFMKVFGNGIIIVDDRNRYEFVKFEEKDEIDFFKSLHWIVDYDTVKDLSDEEIIKLGQMAAEERNSIACMFNSMLDDMKSKHMYSVLRCKMLEFKIYSLRDILWFRQGHIKMTLPDGVQYPKSYKKVDEKGLKKLLKKFKKNFN